MLFRIHWQALHERYEHFQRIDQVKSTPKNAHGKDIYDTRETYTNNLSSGKHTLGKCEHSYDTEQFNEFSDNQNDDTLDSSYQRMICYQMSEVIDSLDKEDTDDVYIKQESSSTSSRFSDDNREALRNEQETQTDVSNMDDNGLQNEDLHLNTKTEMKVSDYRLIFKEMFALLQKGQAIAQ